ncbi:glycosyl hydrolases 35 family protein [Pseudarthrobacter siccitolerans]|uniref:Glycosyl hydrolases 35 family protein n=1 Tax=Pseudarthrobacter siccitolerans TaxID=861266 RepID=A0A024H415_9MICC|nr:beta-galactosidase [Pseudarthrobacter siccitolerans]CCQ46484.1 glycosyl hydrolases 35 family protein [Pseudarthrobacter siccitolerans]
MPPEQTTLELLTATHRPHERALHLPPMSNTLDQHTRWRVTSHYIEVDGRPTVPVSGEIHFSRLPRSRWEDRLRLMKAGGITVVACYVFWIHHEQVEGEARFDGNLDVAAFVRLCAALELDVVLRIGPWCHGEVRNGGFPDWVQTAAVGHRTNDPAYLAMVERWFNRLGTELAGLTGPASNVIGIQLENELYDQPGHITRLKNLARAAGLSAPIWTATAWGGADIPEEEVLPVFGGYGDGFWVDADAPWDPTFRQHYFFSHQWDDPGIGADLREHFAGSEAEPPRSPSALYPPATCELTGGMATAYQRRPWPAGKDVAAVANNKIGSGSGWQGYYMFTGGTNPSVRLQESQATGYPNDLPVFDYDFHAPIGAAGRLAPSFALLRRQHAFLAAFGDRLAPMPSTLPDQVPVGVEDSQTLRWALRSDGESGFVFITWHQPHVPLPLYAGAQFSLSLGEERITFPGQPVAIPAGTIAAWPVNLDLAGVRLRWATASPLTLLGPEAAPTLVLAAEAGIEPQLCFAQGTVLEGPAVALGGGAYAADPTTPTALTARTSEGALNILILPADLADQAWVLDTRRGRELVLSADPLWVGADGRLAGRSPGSPAIRRYSTESGQFEEVRVAGQGPEPARRTLAAERIRAAPPVPVSFGSLSGRAAAPTDRDMDEFAEVYRLEPVAAFPAGEGHTELEITWAGDVARLLVDGTVVADRFWDGSSWVIETHDAGIRPGAEILLQILPLPREAKAGVPQAAQQRRNDADGDLAALDTVELIHWTAWREAPA